MICHMPVFVGAGSLPDSAIKSFCKVLSREWGGTLFQYSAHESPKQILTSLPISSKGLVELIGDPAKTLADGCNWLEALGAWRYPTILIAHSSPSGISGSVLAYAALCKELHVPLVGIVQYGGDWEPELRRLDGLPWCGWLPEINKQDSEATIDNDYYESIQIIIRRIHSRLDYIQN